MSYSLYLKPTWRRRALEVSLVWNSKVVLVLNLVLVVKSKAPYNMDPLSETDVIQSDSPENFVVIFEILPIDKEWKSNEITSCRCWASCGFNSRNATHQVDFFPHRLHSNSNSSTVFCFTDQKSNSVSFSPSQCCRLLKLLSSRFSREVDVVLGEVVYHKFKAHHY